MRTQVNRVEVIDHTAGGEGRVFTKWTEGEFEFETVIQDEGRTLKIFLKEPEND